MWRNTGKSGLRDVSLSSKHRSLTHNLELNQNILLLAKNLDNIQNICYYGDIGVPKCHLSPNPVQVALLRLSSPS